MPSRGLATGVDADLSPLLPVGFEFCVNVPLAALTSVRPSTLKVRQGHKRTQDLSVPKVCFRAAGR